MKCYKNRKSWTDPSKTLFSPATLKSRFQCCVNCVNCCVICVNCSSYHCSWVLFNLFQDYTLQLHNTRMVLSLENIHFWWELQQFQVSLFVLNLPFCSLNSQVPWSLFSTFMHVYTAFSIALWKLLCSRHGSHQSVFLEKSRLCQCKPTFHIPCP